MAGGRRRAAGSVEPARAVLDCVAMGVTIYGVLALSFMMLMYALEHRGRWFVAGFAVGCIRSSVYGFLSGAWPFGVVELVWSAIAWRRFGVEPVAA